MSFSVIKTLLQIFLISYNGKNATSSKRITLSLINCSNRVAPFFVPQGNNERLGKHLVFFLPYDIFLN